MATISHEIPEGNKAPLIALDDDHHGSFLVICSAFGLVIILFTLIIRIYLRYRVSPPFATDDIALTISTALAVTQCSLVFAGVDKGDGTSIDLIDEQSLVPIQHLNYAANIFYILTLYASKTCVVLLFKRISSGIMHKKVAWIALAIVLTTGIISIFLGALRCDLSKPWLLSGSAKCQSLPAQWKAITALDIATEIGLFAMAVHLVWGLQAAVPTKLRVIFAFGLRLPVIPLAILQLHFSLQKFSSPNPPLTGVPSTIARQTEIFYAIMASTIPCLRPFLASFFTGFGAMGCETVIAGSQVGGGGSSSREKGSGSQYVLNSLQSAESKRLERERNNFGLERQNEARVGCGPGFDGSGMVRTAGGGTMDASSIASNESTRMIITKEVQWHVDRESNGERV